MSGGIRGAGLGRRLAGNGDRLRQGQRILLAAAASAGLDLLVWSVRSTKLTGHVNVVGYPTFANFDPGPLFLSYRLITYAFPAGVIVFYLLLGLKGPLSSARRPRAAQVLLVVREAAGPSQSERVRGGSHFWRLLAPAAFVGLVSSVPLTGYQVHPTTWSFLFATLYVLLVLSAAALALLVWRTDGRLAADFGSTVALVSAPAVATVAIGGVWFISRNTRVVLNGDSTRHWAWLPWWLAALAVLGAWAWIFYDLRVRRSADETEHRVRLVLLGSAAMYMLAAGVPLARFYFQGYDDAINVTGAYLIQHGHFPWRDVQFNHGLFPDVFVSLIGFKLFGETAWGSDAGQQLVLVPIAWIGIYLLGVWALRRRSIWVLAPLVFVAWHQVTMDPRFIAFPFVLLLFGKELTERRLAWTCALTVALFAEAVCVPEADYQVLAVLAAVLASDLVHRRGGEPFRTTFRRTICVAVTGVVLMLALAAFLASQHALAAFIAWFRVFLPDHKFEGAVPPGSVAGNPLFLFRLMVALVIATVLWAAWQFRERAPWTPRGWVILAAAVNAGLYGEQALGRFDVPHVLYSVTVGLFLMTLVGAAVIPTIDAWLTAPVARIRIKGRRLPPLSPVSYGLGLLALLTLPVANTIWHSGSQSTANLGTVRTNTMLGYSQAGAFPNHLLPDLRTVLDTYAPRNAPFFDMTNAEGYFYFLLQRRPASAFVNVSMAMTEYAQRLLISQLAKSRPPLIAFNAAAIGLPSWDYVQNQVRHFMVSQYILDHWTPVIEAQGVLFLLRNDLVKRRPPLPRLSQTPVTSISDLYASEGSCNWGDAANFLESEPEGHSVSLPAQRLPDRRQISISGWSFDPKTDQVPKEVYVVVGHRIVATGPIYAPSPQIGVRFNSKPAASSGFAFNFTTATPGAISVYVLTANNAVHPVAAAGFRLGKPQSSVPVPSGVVSAVRGSPIGAVTAMTATRLYVRRFQLPRRDPIAGFDLATLSATRPIGNAQLSLSSERGAVLGITSGTSILANALPATGSRIAVRVGSCLNWHDFKGRSLYLAQAGGTPITHLELSGVQS